MQGDTLETLLKDYRALLDILQREGPAGDVGDASLDYLVRTTQSAIALLGDAQTSHTALTPKLRDELVEIYDQLTRPRIGLYDYFVCRDDVSERKQANAALDTIKDDLKRVYTTL